MQKAECRGAEWPFFGVCKTIDPPYGRGHGEDRSILLFKFVCAG